MLYLINCIREINNAQTDNAHDIDAVMPVYYNWMEHSDSYSKTSEILWQFYRDEPALTDNDVLLIFLPISIIVIRSEKNSNGN